MEQKKIGERAFFKCVKLKNISDLEHITSIGDEAFSGCTILNSDINLDQATSIGMKAFKGCKNLVCISAPRVKKIKKLTFEGCERLELERVKFAEGCRFDPTAFNNSSLMINDKKELVPRK